jgi:hypothetical protein
MAMIGVKESDRTRRTFTGFVSSNCFSTLGVSLLMGRPFTTQEEKPGGELTVIVTYPFWRKTGEDARILCKQLRINGHLFTVVGITPQGFTGTTALLSAEVYVPLGAYNVVMNGGSDHSKLLAERDNDALIVMGRLKPDITQHAAGVKLAVTASQIEKAFPAESKGWTLPAGPFTRFGIYGRPADDRVLRLPAILLLPLAGVVLLIASLTLANMMMVQGCGAAQGNCDSASYWRRAPAHRAATGHRRASSGGSRWCDRTLRSLLEPQRFSSDRWPAWHQWTLSTTRRLMYASLSSPLLSV